jgi:hypothetical protein
MQGIMLDKNKYCLLPQQGEANILPMYNTSELFSQLMGCWTSGVTSPTFITSGPHPSFPLEEQRKDSQY